jgi:CheY-like chemotaxis protein
MNNVLAAILGLATASVESQPPGSSARRAFDTIAQAAQRGGKLVQGLLNFARRTPAEERQLDLNALLREEAGLLEHTTLSKIRLVLDLAEDLHPVQGDGAALSHAFMNLCVNAVDAMPENGTLTLRSRNLEDGWVEVRVEDTGTGMPAETLAKAMDPFFTTKMPGKGTGLGLSMVYSTVKAHRGRMELQSRIGRGTQVQLLFPPAGPDGAAPEPAPGRAGARLQRPLEVLLVDDDELVQSSSRLVLEMLGHRVATAGCGEEALAMLGTGFAPDVVILDMNMPGLGGAGTLPRLRALRPAMPVLLATGRVDQKALDLAERHRFVKLLPKPFALQDLKETLAGILPGA